MHFTPQFVLAAAATLPALSSAHFLLNFPAARGFNDDSAGDFPCGGFDSAVTNRTSIPIGSSFPIQLDMHHTEANVQVLLGVGNDVGTAYNYVLRPLVRERGPSNFCLGDVVIPAQLAGVNLTEGTNATIQVVTNGDPSGGLYQCADITLTRTALSSSDYDAHCTNSTGVTAQFANTDANANQSTSSTTGSSTASAATASSTSGAAAAVAPTSLAWTSMLSLGALLLAAGAAAL